MLTFSLFLGGFTLGVFVALRVFSPEKHEDIWDPQHIPEMAPENKTRIVSYKAFLQESQSTRLLSKKPQTAVV